MKIMGALEEYRASLDLAHRYKLTVYDASCLALALALDIKLVTADKKLATRTSLLGTVQRI
ncbi:MAG: PIN domain-containing protein [Deltaproteobacteria bacterium]|nr:PIN domain-containing protein [Deltaproteobacteria bacterium]